MDLNRVYTQSWDSNSIIIDKAEAVRYLGAAVDGISKGEAELVSSCVHEISSLMTPKACYMIMSVKFQQPDLIIIGDSIENAYVWKSCDLSNWIAQSRYVILFAATIGIEIDRAMLKYSYTSPARAAVMQAVSAAAIEAVCDKLCDKLSCDAAEIDMKLTERFSAGYGDFGISHQQDLFDLLDCPKNVGISLASSMQMTPSKSVTAVIGMFDSDGDVQAEQQKLCGNNKGGCKMCNKTDCPYRRID